MIVKYLNIFFKDVPTDLTDEEFLVLKNSVSDKMNELYDRAVTVFSENHDIDVDLEFTSINNFVRITDTGLDAHSDNNRPGSKTVRYGCVLYLTDNYDGGELVYNSLGLSYKPIAGQLAMHPGTDEYTHSVNDVSNGIRYTSTMFVIEK